MTSIDLNMLTRPQLKQLIKDASGELELREHEERLALEEKLRSLVQDAGFDPAELQFGAGRKAKRGKSTKSNGETNE